MSNVSRARCSVRANKTTSFDRTAHTSSPAVSAVSVWSSPAGWSTAAPRALCSTVDPNPPMSSEGSSPSLKEARKSPSCRGDISASEVAERLVTAAEETGLALRGVVHGAAVIDDQIVAALSRESLDRVWAPKAAGRLAAARCHGRPRARLVGWVLFDVVPAGFARAGARTPLRVRGSMPWSRGDGHRVCLPPRSIGASGPTSASLAH